MPLAVWLIVLLLSATSVWADPLPALPPAGTWATYPNSNLRPAMNAAAGTTIPWNPLFIFDYSGGCFDTTRNELMIWGGGHADYPGNEVCRFNIAAGAWTCGTRSDYNPLNAQGIPINTVNALPDGKPAARHTYGSLACFKDGANDGFFVHGGSLAGGGFPTNGAWFYHRDTLTWEALPSTTNNSLTDFASYDPVRQVVHIQARGQMYDYNPVTQIFADRGTFSDCTDCQLGHAFDVQRQRFLLIGAGFTIFWDTSTNPWTRIGISITGDTFPVSMLAPGLVFDTVGNRYLAYAGNQTIYSINRDTFVSTALPFAGPNPGLQYDVGTYGRFAFVPSTNGVIVVNSIDSNVYYYQLGAVPTTVPVPNVVGQTQAAASSSITGVGLVLGTVTTANSPTVPSGSVISESPVAGTVVAVGTAVNLVVSNGPAAPANIPSRVFVLLPDPPWNGIYLLGPDGTTGQPAPSYHDKHQQGARNPDNGLIYFMAGDYYSASYRNEMWTFDPTVQLSLPLSSPFHAYQGWNLEYKYCGDNILHNPKVQPKGPDFPGWTWDSLRHVFWMIPGEMDPHGAFAALCPGEIPDSYTDNDGYLLFGHIMTYDPATHLWADKGFLGKKSTRSATYDPVTDTIVSPGPNNDMGVYNIVANTWTYYPITVSTLWAANIWAADLAHRKIWIVDASFRGLFYWDMDLHTATVVAASPCPPLPEDTVQSDKGYLVYDSNNNIVIQMCYQGLGVWAYHPNTNTWEDLSSLPIQGQDGTPPVFNTSPYTAGGVGIAQWNAGIVFDPVNNWVVARGWQGTWLFRYAAAATTTVPNVVGLTQAAATTAITGANLTLGAVTSQSSPTVPAGNVISQNPIATVSVPTGSAVAIVVSSGPPGVAVPNVVGLTQAAASTSITSFGLVVGTVTNTSSPAVPSGSVISQNPVAGTNVAPGSAVNLVVSTGPALVTVPNVVNQTQAAATSSITTAGLTVGTVSTASSPTVPAGRVISQNPVAGASVVLGSAVNLVVSTGTSGITVPSVVGLTTAAATTTITLANLVVGMITTATSSTVAVDHIISQDPVAGTNVSSGSAVNLVVSTGLPSVTVPNVVGRTQSDASSALTAASLTTGTVTSASSSTVPTGSVISQNPAAGAVVAAGSAVAMVVSTGPASGAILSINPVLTLNFLKVKTSTTKNIIATITNTGASNLVMTQITVSGLHASEFTLGSDACSNQTIAASGTCQVHVIFAPTYPGAKTGVLSIPSNAPGTPKKITLYGTGKPG